MTKEELDKYHAEMREKYEVRPDVLNYEDVRKMIPKLDGHEKLVNRILHFLKVDEVNAVHGRWCDTPGPEFVQHLVEDDFRLKLRIDNREVLDNMPNGQFITISNHPFGAIDGITLIYLVTRRFRDYKVMVNMFLNKITAMRPNFIGVDAWHRDDSSKKNASMQGIRESIRQIREGKPLGFFPAGAMSFPDIHGNRNDQPWQKSVIQIIEKAKVPVIPIFFHGGNSWLFNLAGHIYVPARSVLLPREVFKKRDKEIHISIGNPITVEQQQAHSNSIEELGAFLRERTYSLRDEYK